MESILFLLANIYVCVVSKLAIKQYCFFVLLSCVQDKCFANSNYVMVRRLDTIQLLFNIVLVGIHSSVASSKAIVLIKCEEDGSDTWKKNSRWKNNK